MGGCGKNCACAQMDDKETCAVPEGGVKFDAEGKCPCGKFNTECCHTKDAYDALHELCEPHNGKHVCDEEPNSAETAN